MSLFHTLAGLLGWWPAVLILLALLIIIFILLAMVCDECLAPALEELSKKWNIPHDVASATFLALGSSAPEIAISVVAIVFNGKRTSVDMSLGTLMGSALIAFTVIPAACILVSPNQTLQLEIVPLLRDVLFFCLGLGCITEYTKDGDVDTLESCTLVGMFLLYLLALRMLAPLYNKEEEVVKENKEEDKEAAAATQTYGTMSEQQDEEEGDEEETTRIRQTLRYVLPPFHFHEEKAIQTHYGWLFAVSVAYVCVFSELSMILSESLAQGLGISHHAAGLFLIAVGAQLPDTIASMSVAKKGEGPSSISNAIGSQVFNINLGLGVPMLVSNLWRNQSVELVAATQSAGAGVFICVATFLGCVLASKTNLSLGSAGVLGGVYVFVLLASLGNYQFST